MKKRFPMMKQAFLLGVVLKSAMAVDVPAILPKPDDTPPSGGKVKVYILAGQSNMVGFGYLKDSRPVYPSIFLSADPKAKVGRMPVGPSALLKFGVYGSEKPNAWKGALGQVYKGEYDPALDYEKEQAAKTASFALGTVSEKIPSIEGPHTVIAKAAIEVPMSGTFEVHPGFEISTYAIVSLEGKEVYRREVGKDAVITPIQLEGGKRYPIKVTFLRGGSAALWLKQIDLKGHGDLESLNKEGKYTWFSDEKGEWTVRNDVTYWETRVSKEEGGSGGLLTATSNGRFIGPEVPFGYVMGTYHEEPVLLIESSMGNRALSFDFRPPSSGKTEEEKANKYCGLEYDLMVEGVHKTLKNIDKIVPNYKGQGYEVAGFVWFQGHKDKNVPKEVYEKHLVNLIKDVRKEFKTPKMPAVVATVGFSGMQVHYGLAGRRPELLSYNVDIPKAGKYEFTGHVCSVTMNQEFLLRINRRTLVDVDIPYTKAEWMNTEPVELELKEGRNRISFTQKAPNKGLSIREFKLKPVKEKVAVEK